MEEGMMVVGVEIGSKGHDPGQQMSAGVRLRRKGTMIPLLYDAMEIQGPL